MGTLAQDFRSGWAERKGFGQSSSCHHFLTGHERYPMAVMPQVGLIVTADFGASLAKLTFPIAP